jgi:hypothetical protein
MSSFSASDMFVTRTFFSTDVIIEVPYSLNIRNVCFSDLDSQSNSSSIK